MKNYKINLEKNVEKIIEIFNKENYEIFVVGGSVRDSILGIKVNDWDLTTIAEPDMVLEIAKKYNIKAIPTGIAHGTITYLIENRAYEITTYRLETEYINHRKPIGIKFSKSLKEDLKRRDFTINALAYHPEKGLFDYFGGLQDIKFKKLKTVGDANERLEEDSLRILRAIRFSSKLNFEMDINLINAIESKRNLIHYLSIERIQQEFSKIMISDNVVLGLKLLYKFRIMDIILPELLIMVGFNQNNPNHNLNLLDHTFKVIENTPSNLKLRLVALFHDIGKPQTYSEDDDKVGHFYKHEKVSSEMTYKIMKRLNYSNNLIKNVCNLISLHMNVYNGDYTDKAIKKLVNNLENNSIEEFVIIQKADILGTVNVNEIYRLDELLDRYEIMKNKKEPFNMSDININGNDLIKIGIMKGPKIGKILNEIFELVLDEKINNDKMQLIDYVKRYYK